MYFLDLTAGSKQLAFWTFAAQYALVAVILPQLFPKVMLPFTMQDLVDYLIKQNPKSFDTDNFQTKLTQHYKTTDEKLPQLIKSLDKTIDGQNDQVKKLSNTIKLMY